MEGMMKNLFKKAVRIIKKSWLPCLIIILTLLLVVGGFWLLIDNASLEQDGWVAASERDPTCSRISAPPEAWHDNVFRVPHDINTGTDIYSSPVRCWLNQYTFGGIQAMVDVFGHADMTIRSPDGKAYSVSSGMCLEALLAAGPAVPARNLCVSFLRTWQTGEREYRFTEDGLPQIRRSDYQKMPLPLDFQAR